MNRHQWGPSSFVLATVLVYLAAFAPLYRLVGEPAMTFAALPLAAIGWMFGWRRGLLGGLLSFPLHLVILTVMGTLDWSAILGAWPIWFISFAAGPVGGWAAEAEGKRGQFFELSLDMLCIAGTDGYFKQVNHAWERTLGYRRAELCARPFIEFVHPDDRQRTHAVMEQLSCGQPAINFENRYRHRDGAYRWLAWTCSAVGNKHSLLCAVARDITEQKQMGLAIRTSEERFRAIFENAGAGISVREIRGHLTECNSVWTEMIGYTKEELCGMSVADYTHPDDLARDQGLFQELMDGRRDSYHLEQRYIHKSGRVWWAHLSRSLIRDETGVPQFTVAIIKDMTSQKEAEAACRRLGEELEHRVVQRTQELLAANRTLRTLESWQRTLIDAIQGIVWECDAKSWRFTFVSPQAETVLGYPVSQWLDQPDFWQAHIHPDDRAWVLDYCAKTAREKAKYSFEYRMMAADGRILWLRDIVTVEQEQREPVVLRGIMVDITDSKRAEEELRRSGAFIDSVVEHLPNMLFVKDAKELRFVRFNKAGEKLLGYTRDQLLGQTDYAMFPKEEADFFMAMDRAVLESGRLLDIPEEPIQTNGNGMRILHTKKIPICDDRGIPQYLLGISEDITERKQAERALRESEERLRQAVRVGHIGIFDHDHLTDHIYWSPETRHMFGWDAHEPVALEQGLAQVCAEDRERIMQAVQQAHDPTGDGAFEAQHRIVDCQGALHWLSTRSRTFFEGDGPARRKVRTIGAVADITTLKRTEEALRRSEAQLRAAMDERQELAQDLHDNIIQTIYAIGLILEESRHLLRKEHAQVDQRLEQTIEYLNTVIVDVRHYIAWAAGEQITGDQLCVKVIDLAKRMEGVRGVRFTLDLTSSAANKLTPSQAVHVLYIVQEAMSNGVRHSQCRSSRVSLRVCGQRVRLEIADDGVGFTGENASRRGHGLRNMAMRAEKLGGTLQVVSSPGGGTQVLVEFPWEDRDDSTGHSHDQTVAGR